MSGFLALVDPSRRLLAESSLAPMLATLSSRDDRCEVWRNGHGMLAAARFDWEMTDGFSGPVLVVRDGDVSVAADATLYYRDDLVRELSSAGVRPGGRSPSHLIAAAYRAWDTDCVSRLEGDYAFVIYDHVRARTFAARDFMGRRPLYYAEINGGLAIASMASAIVAHPACSRELDDVALAELIGVSLAGADRTPYLAVRSLPAGTSLLREGAGALRLHPYWSVVVNDDGADDESFDSAAERLADLVGQAMVERRAPTGSTTIWLSGGYDSPVMYGLGNAALDRVGLDRLAPVSFSHPVGDPAREDEMIEEVLSFWAARPTWLSINDVPLLARARENAARADIPFQHAFENWLRGLLGATARQRSRVALYGDGGDQLFAVSTVFLRDLLTGFRWRELREEWRALGGSGLRALWRNVVQPVLNDRARRLRGPAHIPNPFPEWVRTDFIARHSLDRREADAEAELASGGAGYASTETRRSLANPVTPRVLAGFSALGLEHGVELRAPLLDRRLVEFALQRPRTERASAGAVKHLLRHAARSVLPPSVLAARAGQKTGTLTGYFARSFRADPDGLVSDTLANSTLARRGIIDDSALQKAWRAYQSDGRGSGGHLFVVFQTEMWLSARDHNAIVTREYTPFVMNMPTAGFVQ